MELVFKLLYAFIAAFIASFGFAVFFGNRGKYIFLAAIGGALAWTSYIYFLPISMALAAYVSGSVCAAYAELLAKIYKSPAAIFLIIAILPMVPGADIFNTMKAAVFQDYTLFSRSLNNTLTISGFIALGIIIIFSLVVLQKNIRRNWRNKDSMLS
ncbi:threonine/serine exporter family protein [Amygdalobacter indicium]|jgi:hypothetical protein|uniref:threonine/serine exporter family protein n=1 Tax=Amygdalobacter indicium TaxID=3029272 RepID=UPI00279833A5|nr:threonine/serine exporter family protein [Amygdalobacter indicium]WEG34651.1 threonine/serine exporter family protein [Amygdalobacter indicium]